MFRTFLGFEINYWLKGVMVYIFLFIMSLMVMGAASSDEVTIQESFSNINRNAPYVIQSYYAIMAILTCLMTTAFANDAASRDFAHQTSQLIFTKPIGKFSFLMGRFWGAVMIALIPMLGISVGILIADKMPWVDDPDRYGATNWAAHLWSIVVFAIPNTIFIAAIIFAIAVWLRSTFASFIGIIVLMVFYGISDSLIGNIENETLVQLADPFGYAAFLGQTKYWTIDDRNTQFLTLSNSMLLWNRLIWLSAGLTTLGLACWRFSFAERRSNAKQKPLIATALPTTAIIPKVSFQHGIGASFLQLWSQFKVDLVSTLKSPVFLVVVFAGMIDTFFSLRSVAGEGFGLKALPVTYSMIQIIRGSLFVYMMIVIIFYSGVLVWKEREAKLDEVMDALPHSTWITYTAKILAILCIIVMVIFAEMMMALGVQTLADYDRYQIALYVKELFGVTMVQLFCFTVLAFLAHIVSPNKYIGYFVFIIGVIANFFAWSRFDIESNMVQFAMLPSYTYSDMFEFAPYSEGLAWFSGYWLLFCTLLSCGAIMLWQRGKDRGFFQRIGIAIKRFFGTKMGLATSLVFLVWAGVGSCVFYNSEVKNTYLTSYEQEVRQLEYETLLKEDYSQWVTPRTTDVKYEIDVYPRKRGLVFSGTETLVNQSDEPIEKVMVNLAEGFETELSIGNATVEEEMEKFNVQILKFDPPLAPGESTQMEYTVSYSAKGYENNTSNLEIVQNGTFFNNGIAPQLGYQAQFESTDKEDRKEWDLGPPQAMPELAPNDMAARANTYISSSSDWVNIETIISTSDDQVAVAPGSLVKKWQKEGRRYFNYKVDTPSLNFYSFISANYKVQQRKWKDVDIEVYYHNEHEWNVSNMLQSVRKSLEYYTEEFGPYKHNQARIIEFPRTSSFAQAFPGTMPYSEGIGFIAEIKEEDDIDMVFYVVAHEMAHQWWAHQVIGANMEGATVLSETLAQYSALMVMEKEFGRDIMRKFLKFEMDNYLSSRGREQLEEQPLIKVGAQQGYVHYRKGSVVMYYLKEMIGEDKVNAALKSLIEKFAYKPAPYPTSHDLVEALRTQTPPELEYLLDDLFKEITLFENRTLETSYKKLDNGKFEVTIEIECKKFQAGPEGKQVEVKLNDWIEIGAFAKPEEDSNYGKTLHRDRKKLNSALNTFTFVVDEVPALAGVDPFLLMIDRLPEDNMKKPKLQD